MVFRTISAVLYGNGTEPQGQVGISRTESGNEHLRVKRLDWKAFS